MRLHELKPAPGSRRKRRRVGRGTGSGRGTTAGRGTKGQKARSGGGRSRGFEGGQLSIVKRLPHKRGFTNVFRKEYSIINLDRLAGFPAGAEVSPDSLVAAGVLRSDKKPVKVLGKGELLHSLVVKAHKFSASAKAKIEAAGGTATTIEAGTPTASSTEEGV